MCYWYYDFWPLSLFAIMDILKSRKHETKFVQVHNHDPAAFRSFMMNCQRDLKMCPWILVYVLIQMKTMNCLNRLWWTLGPNTLPKTARFKKYKHGLPPCITRGILCSIKYQDQLFQKARSIANGTDLLYADDTNLTSYMCSFSSQIALQSISMTHLPHNINVELNNTQEWPNIRPFAEW